MSSGARRQVPTKSCCFSLLQLGAAYLTFHTSGPLAVILTPPSELSGKHQMDREAPCTWTSHDKSSRSLDSHPLDASNSMWAGLQCFCTVVTLVPETMPGTHSSNKITAEFFFCCARCSLPPEGATLSVVPRLLIAVTFVAERGL